ncbi:hypothetical protein [Bifidobacterium pseudolongum]|jgi:hypothetical protein|uniref:hypothetical protein n=1 Tax=Bifidobacterium pseudolongum TaxID=1694 RepID=UPI0015F59671|nr:hypothetical protein [Bifidobacterium pseudolongum]MCH4856708.1 hypothetical protein [Bifidobacterium pseudolongum]
MSGKVFIGIYKTGLRLTGYGVMAVGIGIAALAYTRLVRELNDHNHHDYMFDGLF